MKKPNEKEPCYDCGSTIPGHHTTKCDMAPPKAVKDLPCKRGTQHWDKDAGKARPDPHNFAVPRQQWEDAVFVNAVYFRCIQARGDKQWVRKTWPDVRRWLKRVKDPHTYLIYAVTEKERYINVNGADYERLDKLWAEWN